MVVECYDGVIYVNKIFFERRKVNFLCLWFFNLLMCYFLIDCLFIGKFVIYNMIFFFVGKEVFDGKNV